MSLLQEFYKLYGFEEEEDRQDKHEIPSEQSNNTAELPDDSLNDEEETDLDQVAAQASEDPDKQGVIRTVNGSHLVYKRESFDGTFEELWWYKADSIVDSMKIKKMILAGTDIPANKTTSPDGKQTYNLWSIGNGHYIHIENLPN